MKEILNGMEVTVKKPQVINNEHLGKTLQIFFPNYKNYKVLMLEPHANKVKFIFPDEATEKEMEMLSEIIVQSLGDMKLNTPIKLQ